MDLRVACLALGLLSACGGGSKVPPEEPVAVTSLAIGVDAGNVTGALSPLWRDHYDLSYTHMDYASEPGFTGLVDSLAPRSWRCSVGRWEIGFPPPAGGDSLDPAVLRTVEREFYRGPPTLAGADDPLNYEFGYLDAQLADLVARGAEPFLCFDYMPFTLSSEQDPLNANNFNLTLPGVPFSIYSFSNGIRTAPPLDAAVYARVVRNTVRHVRGLFAGTTDFGVQAIEVGNEPDLYDLSGTPLPFFWTGDRLEFIAMYSAVAAELDADPAISGLVELGGGSFAYLEGEAAPTFLDAFLADVALNGTRLDFVSYHSYGDDPLTHLGRMALLNAVLGALGLSPERVNAEWGRALNGLDPVYDTIEHGLFRAEVIAYMQLFGVTRAHEALLRDPSSGSGQLGLVRTGPPAHKPVSDCYRGLGLFDGALSSLQVTAPAGNIVFAGRDAAGTRVVVVALARDPGVGKVTEFELSLGNLPFGGASYELKRWRVTQASSDSGAGVELVSSQVLSGATLEDSVQVAAGMQGLRIWELVRL